MHSTCGGQSAALGAGIQLPPHLRKTSFVVYTGYVISDAYNAGKFMLTGVRTTDTHCPTGLLLRP